MHDKHYQTSYLLFQQLREQEYPKNKNVSLNISKNDKKDESYKLPTTTLLSQKMSYLLVV